MHSRRFREEFEKNSGGFQGERPIQMAAQMDEDTFGQPEGPIGAAQSSGSTNFTQSSREDAVIGSDQRDRGSY
jgi:hypothetical protein